MDKNQIVLKLNSICSGTVLEAGEFGRSGVVSVWIESKTVLQIAECLKNDLEFQLDWLENLSVVELEEVVVVTYFLRSTTTPETLVLRISALPGSKSEKIVFPSVSSIWPMAIPFENEAEQLFGVTFIGKESCELNNKFLLPDLSHGFPLRKSFDFSSTGSAPIQNGGHS
ncbi:MAG: NADH-quinone oxidoreductase subunit C [Bdellovibrio sp.]|nr:NADH-quinone oxidoreductase subunit C [Bdellovibrio sp.]